MSSTFQISSCRGRYANCTIAFALLCTMVWPGHAGLVDFTDRFLKTIENQWGVMAVPRLQVWQKLVKNNRGEASGGIKLVNTFFNQVPYFTDAQHWGQTDYWATPNEMLASFGGDCEDYSISKYLSLKEIGVPIDKLRVTYVRALNLGESHMVLAYYATPDADPLILDNLIGDIKPASQRPDLQPVYGFNDEDLWMGGSSGQKGGASSVRLWRDLLQKLQKEQQM
ncbi:transglutaminase-like cysteine peptidase [Rhodoferax sp.]|uniref:transglutaminase-like cysteine peptidase n=3 Tax=Rhodoferax sp. TaxID=50421 RepID=UPI0026306E60|nr:transglutaminase-like cysteine peptidase [Rhodoferax sp.]MDD2808191.1 transglutaminase-like cysteine peptidase [Rhodoferax sp.]MDD4942016.1 transglutaminase-like cysteine peptidase [Rhodoferax sp.]